MPEQDLFILNSKISAVRKQNKKIRHRIETVCAPLAL